jgi:hypothetical protein
MNVASGGLVSYYQYIEESLSVQYTSNAITGVPPLYGGHLVINDVDRYQK